MRINTLSAVSLCVLFSACSQDSQQVESDPEIPLISAAASGDLPQLQQLLENKPEIDIRDHCEWTPLMKASLNGHLKVVETLLLAGAEANLTDRGGYSPLMLAASNNHAAVVGLLLEYGAEVNQVEDTNGWTALIWAAKQGHQATVIALLEHGAATKLKDHSDKTAKAWAQKGGFDTIVDLIDKSES
jgi:ankyrin repeat protein